MPDLIRNPALQVGEGEMVKMISRFGIFSIGGWTPFFIGVTVVGDFTMPVITRLIRVIPPTVITRFIRVGTVFLIAIFQAPSTQPPLLSSSP